jgi:hypothetical protein
MGAISGEVVGINDGDGVGERKISGDGDSVGVGKAKVGSTVGLSLGEETALGEDVGVAVGEGVGVGLGIKFFQRCRATLAPPISRSSFSQRARIFSRSGGPNGKSALPGKTR